MIGGLIFGNFYCGWMCFFGTVQDIISDIGSIFIKKKFKVSQKIHKYLIYLRYILLAIMMGHLLPKNITILSTINARRNFAMFLGGKAMDILTISIIVLFIVLCLFFEKPFCNYFCVEGARYGIYSIPRIFSISRKKESCINCKKCDKACAMNISVSKSTFIRNPQCLNCFQCISECPVRGTLKYKLMDFKKK